jgi:[acyl-carrier-protein] S-malonyltransferase
MGKSLSDAYPEARDVFKEVDAALGPVTASGKTLSDLMFKGSAEELNLTENTQPALLAVSMAIVRVLDAHGNFRLPEAARFVAGNSLGAYSALCAAGSLPLSDAAKLLRIRGQAMQRAVPVGMGAMGVLIDVDLQNAREIVSAAGGDGVCAIGCDNAPERVTISGGAGAVDRAITLAAERGFTSSTKLAVSVPSHCSLMRPAVDPLRRALEAVEIKRPLVPVIDNVTARSVTEPDALRGLLLRQLTEPVRWRESVLYMKGQGVTEFVECGAGDVLTKLAKLIDGRIKAVSLFAPEDIENFIRLRDSRGLPGPRHRTPVL